MFVARRMFVALAVLFARRGTLGLRGAKPLHLSSSSSATTRLRATTPRAQEDQGLIAAQRVVRQAMSWCGLNSLMYTDGKLNWSHAPVTLCPAPYPRASFEYVQQIQPMINVLIDNIARDREFLVRCLAPVAQSDPFVRRLLDIFGAVPDETVRRGINLGIHRSDYMLNNDNIADNDGDEASPPLQIEINTIASSFGCLSKKVGDLHRHLLLRYSNLDDLKDILREVNLPQPLASDPAYAAGYIPENTSIRMLAFSLALAHFLFRDSAAAVLFIVQPGERNVADQRLLEAELWNAHGVRVEFMTLAQVASRGRLAGQDGKTLIVRPDDKSQEEVHVSVAYFRAGYSPDDYPSESEWKARSLVEAASCTKCPTVGYQLAGTKKVQQALCEDGVMERFVSKEEAQVIRRCFAAQYSLGASASPASERAVSGAIKDGSQWVLKPQREGGGNNLYGAELSAFLQANANDPTLLNSYVLMQRIFPRPQKAAFLRGGKLEILNAISELGIYGTFLGDGTAEPMMNACAGYLLRTKPVGVDEGGVATGYSVLNSVVLTG